MKSKIERTIEIPENTEISIKGNEITMKSSEKEIKKEMNLSGIEIKIENRKIKISAEKATRRESRMIGTICAHLKNMIQGLKENFVYKMEICNIHFPMNVKIEKDQVIIKSFLGEKTLRTAKILPGVNVEIKGNEITISSHDIESAGQTASNIEKATKLKGRDRRIFQDGIFITEKCGEKI